MWNELDPLVQNRELYSINFKKKIIIQKFERIYYKNVTEVWR